MYGGEIQGPIKLQNRFTINIATNVIYNTE